MNIVMALPLLIIGPIGIFFIPIITKLPDLPLRSKLHQRGRTFLYVCGIFICSTGILIFIAPALQLQLPSKFFDTYWTSLLVQYILAIIGVISIVMYRLKLRRSSPPK